MGIQLLANVARSAALFNTIGLNPILKIHPAIGVARVGDSPSSFFIGPERPLAGNTGQDSGAGTAVPPFRDGGKIKRQAARFRVFHYPLGADPEELNLDHPQVAEIEWTVHLANKKAAFFEFVGQRGASGPFLGAVQDRRNKTIPAADRATKLMIDPGPRSIKGASAGPVAFDSSSGNFPKNLAGTPIIDFLGELRTDSKGRLLVLGGRGKSDSSNALPPDANQMAQLGVAGFTGPAISALRPPAPLLQYANNDTWFDDVSDGPVTARVKLKTGKTIAVQFPGWVVVGPPDYAPEIRSVVSLYDAMLDVAVRNLPDPAPPFYTAAALLEFKTLKASFRGTPGFTPKFGLDIEPTLQAGFHSRFVHEPAQFFHSSLTNADLKSTDPAKKPTREAAFNFLRPPAGNATYSGAASMPKLFGDKYDASPGPPRDPKQVLAVTQLQHHLLKLWKDGSFVAGGGPSPTVTPDGLDRAGLESCVGGAFYPGIECSWLIREKGIYSEPFRILHGATVGPLTVGPGFFSQQMALPWQADFLDCVRDATTVGTDFGWWPAQRPDEVYTSAADAATQGTMKEWTRGIAAVGPPTPAAGQDHLNMVKRWNLLGFVLSATVAGKTVFFEQERTHP